MPQETEMLGELLPAGTRVERKNASGRRGGYGRKRRVPSGTQGRVTGRTKFVNVRGGAQRQAIEVEWDEACNVNGGRAKRLWFSLPEHLIPLS